MVDECGASDRDPFAARKDIHGDLPPAYALWSQQYVEPALRDVMGVADGTGMHTAAILAQARRGGSAGRLLTLVSLGCGEARVEIQVARALLEAGLRDFRFSCLDRSAESLARAHDLAAAAGVDAQLAFAQADLEEWAPSGQFDVVIVDQFLHHVVHLERLFETIHQALAPGGIFSTVDMIGRNGHQLWPEALAIVDALWQHWPARLKYNHCLGRHEDVYANWDNAREACEGIRAQDVLPTLLARFHFERFVAVGNLAPTVFGRHFGANFVLTDAEDRARVEQLGRLDHDLIDIGYLTPILMFAILSREPREATRCVRHWTPEFCLRRPRAGDDPPVGGCMPEEPVYFRERSPTVAWLTDGWSSPEPGGVWSNAAVSLVTLPIGPVPPGGYGLRITALGDVAPPKLNQEVAVSIDDVPVGDFRFTVPGALETQTFAIPTALRPDSTLRVGFSYSDPRSRQELGVPGGDCRRTALHLHAVQLVRRD